MTHSQPALLGLRLSNLWGFCVRLLIPLLLLVLTCTSSHALIFYVSNSADTTNQTSLRGAIIAANAIGGNNIIILTNSVYALTIGGSDEDAGFTGDLDITNGNLTILGLANSNVIITATNLGDRVFQILPNAQLTLLDLIIADGIAPGYDEHFANGESGGAIYNQGTLFLENCIVTNNSSGGGNFLEGNGGGTGAGDGGGIYNSGLLTMFDCQVANNASGGGTDGSSGGNGGGIFNSGMCQLNNCVICSNAGGPGGGPEGNAFGFAGSGGSGGGIFNTSEMALNNCSVRGNFSGSGGNAGSASGLVGVGLPPGSRGGAGGDGAGIYSAGVLTLNSCTISGNSSSGGGNGYLGSYGGAGGKGGDGAGIYSTGTLALGTCTISGNTCGNGGEGGKGFAFLAWAGMGGAGGSGGNGGGIFNAGTMTLLASTVSKNTGGAGRAGANGSAGVLIMYEANTNNDTIIPIILSGADGIGGPGGNGGMGGIFSSSTGASMASVRNSLIALNSAAVGGVGGQTQTTNGVNMPVASGASGFPDLAGQFTSRGHNLIGQTNGCGSFTNGANYDLAGSTMAPLNPMLCPLTNNGGFTATLNLLPSSPAIDAGDDTVLNPPDNLTLDQRGQPRKSGAHVDIGAVEYNGLINGMVQPPVLKALQPSGSGFQFTFNAATQTSYSVFASTNLMNWTFLGSATETSPGWFYFEDSTVTNYPEQFYRVRQP